MILYNKTKANFLIRDIEINDRLKLIELINEFFKFINSLETDRIFKVKKNASTKMADIYLKLLGSGKVICLGAFYDNILVSLLLCKIEERPLIEEERIVYIDLAVTKKGYEKKGYMKKLLLELEKTIKKKGINIIELRALVANKEANSFWSKNNFQQFYIRYRKSI